MSNQLIKAFDFDGNLFRVTNVQGADGFIGQDVCRALGITNTSKALAAIPDDEKGITKSYTLGGGPQDLLYVTEAGLYRLIFRSNKPAAERVRKWVFGEVLPSIRKTGGYGERQQLWDALGRVKSARAELIILAALGLTTPALAAAPQSLMPVTLIPPETIFADLLAGLQSDKISRDMFRVLSSTQTRILCLLPQGILEALQRLHPDRYLVQRRELRFSLMQSGLWRPGKYILRIGSDKESELVWRFTILPENQTITNIGDLIQSQNVRTPG